MDTATIDGVAMEYEASGSGEPVLLISTGPIADSFLPFLSEEALTGRHRLIRYRQRRMAAGPQPPAPVTFAQHAADAAALLGHLAVRRAHVVGHSTGAAIALELAIAVPDLVGTLTLLEPPLMDVPAAASFLERAGPALAAYEAGDRGRAMAGFLSVVGGLDWETCRAVIDARVPGGAARALAEADEFFRSYLPTLGAWRFGPDRAARIARPVLSVLGGRTERLFVESHERLRAWFPQLEECRVEEVGHLLHLERPAPVARGVAAFLARHPL